MHVRFKSVCQHSYLSLSTKHPLRPFKLPSVFIRDPRARNAVRSVWTHCITEPRAQVKLARGGSDRILLCQGRWKVNAPARDRAPSISDAPSGRTLILLNPFPSTSCSGSPSSILRS
ncbi:hypothetical protein CDAR_294861 [Caerostris darwini]|uniref:Uncharacterized protein n=1 Tax=Caerostris darwini TaxID=1538125 RepID=A0AAV4UK73_9ARAC|nr:hypothetical protein CDAR_294861 [Caerostris darwini]